MCQKKIYWKSKCFFIKQFCCLKVCQPRLKYMALFDEYIFLIFFQLWAIIRYLQEVISVLFTKCFQQILPTSWFYYLYTLKSTHFHTITSQSVIFQFHFNVYLNNLTSTLSIVSSHLFLCCYLKMYLKMYLMNLMIYYLMNLLLYCPQPLLLHRLVLMPSKIQTINLKLANHCSS